MKRSAFVRWCVRMNDNPWFHVAYVGVYLATILALVSMAFGASRVVERCQECLKVCGCEVQP